MIVKLAYGTHYDYVEANGYRLDPARSQHVFNHSPDGFAWGYGGSGPAQLALALLLESDVFVNDHDPDHSAVEFHQQFKDDIVALWPQEGGTFHLNIGGWVLAERLCRSIAARHETLWQRPLLDELAKFKASRSRQNTPVKVT